MNSTLQIIGESDGDYRKYLTNLVDGQKRFIVRLEEEAAKRPQLAQDISRVVADNKKILEEYQARLRRELNRALSSKKD